MKRKYVIIMCLFVVVLFGFLHIFSGYEKMLIFETNNSNIVAWKNNKATLLLADSDYKQNKNLDKCSWCLTYNNIVIVIGPTKKNDNYTYEYINIYNNNGNYICGINDGTYTLSNNKYVIINDKKQSMIIDAYLEKTIKKSNDYGFLEVLPKGNGNYYYIICKNGKYGVMDDNDNIIIPNIYDNINKMIDVSQRKDNNSFILSLEKGKKYGLCNQDGEIIVPVEYDDVQNRSLNNKDDIVNLHIKLIKDDKQIVVNSNGQKIDLYDKYSHVCQYGNDLYAVRKEDKYGVVTLDNEIIIPLEYKLAGTEYKNRYIGAYTVYKDKGPKKIFDLDGNLISYLNYDDCYCINESIVIVKKNNKYGVVTLKNQKEIIPIEYDGIHGGYRDILHSKNFLTLQNGKPELGNATYGAATKEGKVIIEPEYDSINYLKLNDLISVTKNNRGYLFDKDGNVLIDGLNGSVLNVFMNKDRYYAIISNSSDKQEYKDITKEVLGLT